jgi:hypothetical protein
MRQIACKAENIHLASALPTKASTFPADPLKPRMFTQNDLITLEPDNFLGGKRAEGSIDKTLQ